MTRQVSANGLTLRVPPRWDARLFQRHPEAGERTFAIMHAASFALPNARGDYGSGAVDLMRDDDVLVALVEHEPEAAGTPLFRSEGLPHVVASDFTPRALQRTLPGQSGCQYFFSHRGRAFCLYVVLGSHARRARLVDRANTLIAGLDIR